MFAYRAYLETAAIGMAGIAVIESGEPFVVVFFYDFLA